MNLHIISERGIFDTLILWHNKVRERTSAPQSLNLEGSEPDFARRRTAAQLPSFVRRVHPPEGFVSQEIDEIYCEIKKLRSCAAAFSHHFSHFPLSRILDSAFSIRSIASFMFSMDVA